MKLCATCGTPHPDDVRTSHHPDGCTCGYSLCGGSGPDGCIWMRTLSKPVNEEWPEPPFITYLRLITEREAARKQVKEEHPQLKQIKVSYRAVFAQPTGVLNPMQLKLPGPCPVEIFGSGATWQARELITARRAVYEKFKRFSSAQNAMEVIGAAFAEQLRPWQMWGAVPADSSERKSVERLIEPDEIKLLNDGKVLWKEPDDYRHIIHAPTLPPGERVPSAACGARVRADSFINNKANIEPTCKACAEVWKREYQGK